MVTVSSRLSGQYVLLALQSSHVNVFVVVVVVVLSVCVDVVVIIVIIITNITKY